MVVKQRAVDRLAFQRSERLGDIAHRPDHDAAEIAQGDLDQHKWHHPDLGGTPPGVVSPAAPVAIGPLVYCT